MTEGGKRARHKAATRSMIIRVADRLFLKNGFDAVTVDEIAAECGISTRTIPRYFPTKEDIALAPYRDDLERFRKALANRDGDVISCWQEFVERTTADISTTERRLRRYWAMVAAAPTLDAGRLAIWQEYEDVLADALAEEDDDQEGLSSRLCAAMLITGYAALLRHILSSDDHHVESRVFLDVLDHTAAAFAGFTPVRPRRPARKRPARRADSPTPGS